MRQNVDLPYERQMLIILHDYDNKVREIDELRKEVEELSDALEQFGGKEERSSLKAKYNNIKAKSKSLETKLQEKRELLEQEKRKSAKLSKQVQILSTCLKVVRHKIFKLLAMVEVPALRDLENKISQCMYEYRTYSTEP